MPSAKPPRRRPELLLGAAALLAAAGALLVAGARSGAAPQAPLPQTTVVFTIAEGAKNPFEEPQGELPAPENIPPESYVVGYTGVAVYAQPPAATAKPAAQQAGPVNINTASQAQLETLPGIGPAKAQAILEWRAANGRFTDPAQLLEISGIGEKTLMNMLPYIYI